MIGIGECDGCSAQLLFDNVTHTIDIPKAPHHIALAYTCPYCAHTGRLAATRTEWADVQESVAEVEGSERRALAAAQIELAAIDDVGDLLALWASYPGAPLAEVTPGQRCGCKECEKRRLI